MKEVLKNLSIALIVVIISLYIIQYILGLFGWEISILDLATMLGVRLLGVWILWKIINYFLED